MDPFEYFQNVPSINEKILNYLPYRSIEEVRHVSKHWNDVILDIKRRKSAKDKAFQDKFISAWENPKETRIAFPGYKEVWIADFNVSANVNIMVINTLIQYITGLISIDFKSNNNFPKYISI